LPVTRSVVSPPGHRIESADTGGLLAWVLHDDAADLHGTWLPEAGMLGASLVHRDEELLWTGAGWDGYVRERTFMGIPFLHPWANRLAGFRYHAGRHEVVLDPTSPLLKLDEHGLPIHGVLTASPDWSVIEATADSDNARLVAALDFDRPDLLAAFPFPHRLEMDVRLGGGAVEVRTTVTATGRKRVPIAFGFHPYLRIPEVPRAEWEVDFPVRRRLLTDAQQIPTGESEAVAPISGPIGTRTWDGCYDRLDGTRFEIRGGGRTIAVEFSDGYSVAQIFAPPRQEYICVEPMTAPVNALTEAGRALAWASPRKPYSATFRISARVR
jgi:aldose 1-epimerase